MSILAIINITLPIALLTALGFVAAWRSWLPAAAIPGFGAFIRNFALPSAIFLSVAQRPFAEVFHPGFMLAFGLASLTSLLLSLFLARGILRTSLSLAGVLALAGSMSNGLMIGIPLIIALFGLEALAAIAQQLLIENALLLPLGLLIADLGQTESARDRSVGARLGQTLWSVATNPLVVALALGMVVSLAGLSLPGAVERSLGLLAGAVGGMALMFIGATLYGVRLRARLAELVPAIGIKTLLHPLIMAFAFWLVFLVWKQAGWLPVPTMLANTAIIVATLPTIGVLPALAARYGEEQGVSLLVLIQTLISIVTTPLTIWVLLTVQPFALPA